MKLLVLLCLVALAMADDDFSHRPYGKGYHDDYWDRPYGRSGNVDYHYRIHYPRYHASQGKWEHIGRDGTRGSYYVDEPKSYINVRYDFPHKGGYKW